MLLKRSESRHEISLLSDLHIFLMLRNCQSCRFLMSSLGISHLMAVYSLGLDNVNGTSSNATVINNVSNREHYHKFVRNLSVLSDFSRISWSSQKRYDRSPLSNTFHDFIAAKFVIYFWCCSLQLTHEAKKVLPPLTKEQNRVILGRVLPIICKKS